MCLTTCSSFYYSCLCGDDGHDNDIASDEDDGDGYDDDGDGDNDLVAWWRGGMVDKRILVTPTPKIRTLWGLGLPKSYY